MDALIRSSRRDRETYLHLPFLLENLQSLLQPRLFEFLRFFRLLLPSLTSEYALTEYRIGFRVGEELDSPSKRFAGRGGC